jgi:hypothetical protein
MEQVWKAEQKWDQQQKWKSHENESGADIASPTPSTTTATTPSFLT